MRILSITEKRVLEDGTAVEVPLMPERGLVPLERLMAMEQAHGRRMWAFLHRHALAHGGGDDTEWLDLFSAEIPRHCCGEDWHKWKAAHPPRWDDYFSWTVEAHNAVNVRLGKPVLALSDARSLWIATSSSHETEGECLGHLGTQKMPWKEF